MTVKDTSAMVASMTPELQPGIWVFCTTQDARTIATAGPDALALIRETEGVTLVLPIKIAETLGFNTSLALRQITLTVFSDLEGVGLTAAVANALSDVNIPCNVVAAFHHDHLFVPQGDIDRAMAALIDLQRSTQGM